MNLRERIKYARIIWQCETILVESQRREVLTAKAAVDDHMLGIAPTMGCAALYNQAWVKLCRLKRSRRSITLQAFIKPGLS